MEISVDVSALPQSQIFWGALPAIHKKATTELGAHAPNFGIMLLAYWLEPKSTRTLWTTNDQLRWYLLDIFNTWCSNPFERACVMKIIDIGVDTFAPAESMRVQAHLPTA